MCNLWWAWLLVGMVLGGVGVMGWGLLAMGSLMSREEEEREQRINH
jgi:hypothetical protein